MTPYAKNRQARQPNAHVIDSHTAVATLMFKVIEADGDVDHMEVAHMVNILRQQFSLDSSEIEDLLSAARLAARQNPSLEKLTQAVCREWTPSARRRLLNDFWKIASADDCIHQGERRLIQKIARRLNLHSDEITRAEYDAETKMELGLSA